MATGSPRPYRDGVPDPPELIDPTADGIDECVAAEDLDRRLAAHRRAARAAGFVGRLAAPLAAAVTAAGLLALLLRLIGRDAEPAAWFLLAGTAVACGFAWVKTTAPSTRDIAAELDTHLRAGGLLMALADIPPERRPAAWLARLDPRRDRWADARPFPPVWRFVKAVAVPAAFAALAWSVPVEHPAAARRAAGAGAAGAELTGELRGTLAALRAAGAGDPAALAAVGAQIKGLAGAIGEGGPTGAQWEAADSLRDRLLAAGAEAGAAVLSDPDLMNRAGRAAELLGDGAGLLADSGLGELAADAMTDAAAAAGLPDLPGLDPEALDRLREVTGAGVGGVAEVMGNLSAGQKAELAAAATAALAGGGGPEELVNALPPDLLTGVFDAVGETNPELLARLAGVEPSRVPDASPRFSRPPTPLAVSPPGITRRARDLGAAVESRVPPAVAAAGGVAATLLGGGIPGLDRLTGGSPPARPAAGRPARTEPPPPPANRRVAAGRPVPPRLRGVVSRYFAAAGGGSGGTAGDAAGVAGAGGSGQTPPTAE